MLTLARLRHFLTWRRLCALAAAAGPGLGITGAVMAGQPVVAAALAGLTGAVVLAGLAELVRRTNALRHEAVRTREMLAKEVRSFWERNAGVAGRIESAERRLLGAVETERLAAIDRHQALLTAVERSHKDAAKTVDRSGRVLTAAVERSGRDLAKICRDQTREVEALLQLFRGFEPRAPMPSSGRWALNPTGLLEVLSLVERRQPKTVVELGSGTSSVWIAYALERIGGRLVTLDHDQGYAARTVSWLAAHGLERVAEVRHAPLRPLQLDGAEHRWYDVEALADLKDIDLLVVDGPPQATGPVARYPALRVLESKLSATATVVLDDADRPDEREVVTRWTGTVPGLSLAPQVLTGHAVLAYSRYGG